MCIYVRDERNKRERERGKDFVLIIFTYCRQLWMHFVCVCTEISCFLLVH